MGILHFRDAVVVQNVMIHQNFGAMPIRDINVRIKRSLQVVPRQHVQMLIWISGGVLWGIMVHQRMEHQGVMHVRRLNVQG